MGTIKKTLVSLLWAMSSILTHGAILLIGMLIYSGIYFILGAVSTTKTSYLARFIKRTVLVILYYALLSALHSVGMSYIKIFMLHGYAILAVVILFCIVFALEHMWRKLDQPLLCTDPSAPDFIS